MNELFPADAVTMDSPRLRWIKAHGIRSHNAKAPSGVSQAMYYPEPWCVWLPSNHDATGLPIDPDACGYGVTEDEALADLARKHGMRLWNEEGGA